MISNTYADKILNTLMGVGDNTNTLTALGSVYLGLCSNEPNKNDGSISGEPTSVDSYNRIKVGGTSASETETRFSVSSGATIKNNDEIQFKSAKTDYPATINYWFLSDTKEDGKGTAYLWGKIKDVRFEKTTFTGFMPISDEDKALIMCDSDVFVVTQSTDQQLGLEKDVIYSVSWRGEEHEIKAVEITKGDTTYIGLGDYFTSGEIKAEKPFAILYRTVLDGNEAHGELTVYSLATTNVDVAIYAFGIDIKKNTVPTFYANELQASIDA